MATLRALSGLLIHLRQSRGSQGYSWAFALSQQPQSWISFVQLKWPGALQMQQKLQDLLLLR